MEVVGANGQEVPPGMQLVTLPWGDEIRPLPIMTEYVPRSGLASTDAKIRLTSSAAASTVPSKGQSLPERQDSR